MDLFRRLYPQLIMKSIDVYILGPSTPLEKFNGIVIGVIVRTDEEMKLIVTDGHRYTALQIESAIYFQEQYYEHTVIVK